MSFLFRAFRYLLDPRARLSRESPPDDSGDDVGAIPQGRLGGGLRPRHLLRNPALILGLLVTAALAVVVLFGPLWVSYDPFISTQTMLPHYDAERGEMIRLPFPPSAEYPLGTDEYGNDMVSLIVYGARVTLVTGAYITLARLLLGAILGSLAGWRPGGWFDRLVMNLVGVVASIPMLLSSMILIYALGIRNGVIVFVAALAIVGWTETAQYVRGEILVLRNMPYVEGARAVGLSDPQIVVRHILPNVLPQLLILAFLEMGAVLILVAELGFLDVYIGGGSLFSMDPTFGATVRLADVPEWGALVARGAPSLRANAHLVMGPALAFFVAIVGMNALGEGLRRLLQHTQVNTAVLLKRRTLLAFATFLLLSRLVIQLTGPDYSFKRVAADFDAANAIAEAQAITAAGDTLQPARGVDFDVAAAAVYLQEQFVALDIQRGWKPEGGINQSYFYTVNGPQGPAVKAVVGFMPGYDARLSSELIVLLAPFEIAEQDEEARSGPHSLSGVAFMLEMARLWREHDVDPRRSVLLVAWRGDLDEAQTLLSDPQIFDFLPAPTRLTPRPVMLLRLDDVGSGDDVLLLHAASDQTLIHLFEQAARDGDVPVEQASYAAAAPRLEDHPAIALRWANADRVQALRYDRLQQAGQLLNLVLLRITRLPDYAL